MSILFLHGWQSIPGGVKPTYLKDHGHTVINPALPDDDFTAALAIAQAEFDKHQPNVIVGSSRGGALAMNLQAGETPLVLLCPAWKKYGTARTIGANSTILHSRADDVVPYADSEELVRNSGLPVSTLIETGSDHRLADPESLGKMLRACEEEVTVKTFVFLDTNIFVRYCTQATARFAPKSWEKLVSAIQSGNIELLLPEVVSLEVEKSQKSLEGRLSEDVGKIEKSVKECISDEKNRIWNELGDIASAIKKHNESWLKNRVAEIRSRENEVSLLLTSASVTRIELTSEILLKVRKRHLSGQLPYMADSKNQPHTSSDPDLWIIESLVEAFRRRIVQGIEEPCQLLFCTENAKDFCVFEEQSKTNALHPTLKVGLPPTKVFTDIDSLVAFLEGHKPVIEPPPDKVEQAAERERREQARREEAQRRAAARPIPIELLPSKGLYALVSPPEPDDYERVAAEAQPFVDVGNAADGQADQPVAAVGVGEGLHYFLTVHDRSQSTTASPARSSVVSRCRQPH